MVVSGRFGFVDDSYSSLLMIRSFEVFLFTSFFKSKSLQLSKAGVWFNSTDLHHTQTTSALQSLQKSSAIRPGNNVARMNGKLQEQVQSFK